MAPRISVLIGAHNHEHTLPRAVDSMLAQTGEALELIVIDDGSTDRAVEVAESLAAGDVGGVLMRFNPIPNTSAAFRRDLVLTLGGYDARYRYAAEYDLWLRVAEGHGVVTLDEPLSTRVMSSTNVAARAERAQTAEAIAIRLRALRRRRTLRGASGLLAPALSYLTPLPLKRARRRRLGQAA